ncbi:hypothetical protein TpMuguga_03g00277 [Theileria parva strain Muguga]|uniref:uncharacterized protein n=1 Tax=Theileria parva strain Muguga TaxID=333668 RepID=UPI001C620DC9|nr:uncharacterized protein TpMuguga_03g00277 [Theileria parva strain Muguga]EAN31012.2 hypothetical protein TpMuguga_03g00277 [Theileria parva strain Muguga]
MKLFYFIKLIFSYFLYILNFIDRTESIQLDSTSTHGSYTPSLEKNDIPNEIAKIFTFKDKNSSNVCFLRNTYLDIDEVPKECTCTFSRLQKIELDCANEQILNAKNCDKNMCETCCVLSLSPKFNKDFSNSEAPVNCKMRCFNSPTVTDITQDSLQTLNDYLIKIDSLYNVQPPKIHVEGKKEVPTQYEILPLNNKDESL